MPAHGSALDDGAPPADSVAADATLAADEAERSTAETDADARALASVLRMRILRLCLDEALTNKEIAERLGLPPGNTYHHVRTLVQRGFLAAQPERSGVRGAREVPYLATGKSWKTPMGPSGNRVLIDAFLTEVALAPPDSVNTARLGLRIGPEHQQRLGDLLREFLEELASWPSEPDGTPLSMFFAIHEDVARRRTYPETENPED